MSESDQYQVRISAFGPVSTGAQQLLKVTEYGIVYLQEGVFSNFET
jgi:hypothetical protein